MVSALEKQIYYSIAVGSVFLDVTGRKRTKKGYVLLCIHDHPNSDPQGYVMEHRVMVESMMGRFLNEDEIVHHKNEIKHDNRLTNLEVMGKAEHTKLHHVGAKRNRETREKMSKIAKEKYSDRKNHPMFKDVDGLLKELYESGERPMHIQEKLNISRRTYYNKIQYLGLEKTR